MSIVVLLLYTETDRSNVMNHISASSLKKCTSSNYQHNYSFDEHHTSNVFLNPYNLRDMIPPAPMSLNHFSDRESMSNQYPQPFTHHHRKDSYPVFSSLRTICNRRKGLSTSCAFFHRKYLPADEWTRLLLQLKTWVIPGNVEQLMEFRRFW